MYIFFRTIRTDTKCVKVTTCTRTVVGNRAAVFKGQLFTC